MSVETDDVSVQRQVVNTALKTA